MEQRVAWAGTVMAGAAIWLTSAGSAPAPHAQSAQVPIFEYDPTFPKPLPENWAIGAIGGWPSIDRITFYVVQRPGTLRNNERFTGAADTPPKADCCIPAPPVLEFDQAGTLVHSWGGPGAGTTGRRSSTASSSINRTRCGSRRQRRQGRAAPEVHARGQIPAAVRQARHEAAAPTRRTWASPPTSRSIPSRTRSTSRMATATGASSCSMREHSPSSGCGAHTGTSRMMRRSARIILMRRRRSSSASRTIFRSRATASSTSPIARTTASRSSARTGMFVKETFISKRTLLQGAASGFALSSDPQQRFLYMIDGANHHVWILTGNHQGDRAVRPAGPVRRLAQRAARHRRDGRGNIYVGEKLRCSPLSALSVQGARHSKGRNDSSDHADPVNTRTFITAALSSRRHENHDVFFRIGPLRVLRGFVMMTLLTHRLDAVTESPAVRLHIGE